MRRFICALMIVALLLGAASASVYLVCDGYSQSARATTKLSLRQDPTTNSTDLGTYSVSGQYITLDGKCWDSTNNIWWVWCNFSYNGKQIRGWTGTKRFDGNTYSLSDLPEYAIGTGYSYNYDDYDDCDDDDYCCSQYALATTKLSLRALPTTKSTYVGAYNVSGEYIELSARSWDSANNIWWVECNFSYNGKWITGWTGTKRFDGNTYDLFSLPEYYY